jgi:N-acetylmuramoyl-L-alanine amidase
VYVAKLDRDMGNYTTMIKRVTASISFVLFLFLGAGYSIETAPVQPKAGKPSGAAPVEVSVRFSKNEGFNRIVFEASDDVFIKESVITTLPNQIKIQFPSPFTVKIQGSLDLEASQKGRSYVITINHPFKTKVLKLSAPPRLSIDMIALPKPEGAKAPPTESVPNEPFPNFRIVLDPGHGGYDLGILSGDLREKDITLSVAREIESLLLRRHKAASLTRRSDQFLSITDRAQSAYQKPPDIFISLHLSLSGGFVMYTSLAEAANSDVTSPTELYSQMSRQRRFLEKSKSLAEGLGKAIKDEFKTEIVYRDMSLPLLNFIGAPAVLIELPATVVYDKATRTRVAEAILKGISSYAVR